MFALILPGPAGVVYELFDVEPVLPEAHTVVDVSAVAGIAVGWTRASDGKGGFTIAAPPAPVVAPPSVSDLVAYAAARRYTVETGGVSLNGVTIATDRDSQSMVANAYAGMQASGAASVKFKAASGWIELSADQLKALALAVFAHVQACFAAEDAADAGINAVPPTIATFAQVDAAFAGLLPPA